jgi:hydroxymethylbilane synthase
MTADLRLGTRGSALALAQAGTVSRALSGAEVVRVKTADADVGDKGRFVRGVEDALLAGDVDVGVHSAKDLPGELPEGLEIVAVPGREDPRDAYVGPAAAVDEIPEGARIGTASLRRRSQLLALRPDLEVVELRGNVDTRLRKLADGECDGIVLAVAGLRRLGRGGEISFTFPGAEMTPAPGQGALALEVRAGDERARYAASQLGDRAAIIEFTAERAATVALGATCERRRRWGPGLGSGCSRRARRR